MEMTNTFTAENLNQFDVIFYDNGKGGAYAAVDRHLFGGMIAVTVEHKNTYKSTNIHKSRIIAVAKAA